MRKLYTLRAYLTLCILAISSLIGGVSAQAQETTVTSEFQDAKLNVSNGTPKWTVDKAATGKDNQTGDKYRGIQWGVGKGEIVLTSEDEFENVTSVVVVASTNGSNNTISVSVGTSTFGDALTISSGTSNANKNYSFNGNATGNISIKLNDKNKSVYVKSISITYVKDGPILKDPTIAFSESAYKMNLGTELTVKATTTSDAKISYTSSDPKVAAIDAETGVVTAKKEGKVMITAKVEATETYTAKSATCELTVTDSRTAPEFSFAEALYTVNIDQTMQIKPVTNSTGVVSYASSDATVAEIDAEGNVTAKAEGEATITATIAATDEFKSATATCLVKVVDPNKPAEVVTPMQFKKITSVDELIDGGQYIIVCEKKNVVSAPYDKSLAYVGKVEATVSASAIDLNDGFGVITLKKYTSNWSLCLGNNYIGKKENINNSLKFAANDSGNDYKWTIGFDTDGNAQIKSVSQKTYQMAYNSSSPRFSSYQSIGNSIMNVQLYRLETSATINEKVGYTTFYTDKKYQMPAGLTAYAIAQAEEAGTVTMQQAYGEGENVPAYTALLMGGEAGTYRLPVLNTEVPAYGGSNLLEGRRSADNMTSSERENVLYYKLTLLDGENPGFYWGAEGGAAFVMKNPTTAYLAVPETVAAANGFRLVMGDATGIGSVTAAAAQDSAAIYTLSGVRVNATTAAGLPKGIYIVNGRKLLVK